MPTIADQELELKKQIVSITMAKWRELPPKRQDDQMHSMVWSALRLATLDQLEKWRYHVEHTWSPEMEE